MTCARKNCHRSVKRAGLCAQHYKPQGYCPSGPVIARYQRLRGCGLTGAEIARLSGVHRDTLRMMGRWSEGRVRKETADRVMAVRVPDEMQDSHAEVSAVGTVRRLQALARQGHSLGFLAGQLGVTQQSVTILLKRDRVHSSTARRVAEVFERLQWVVGESVRARNHAVRRGWLPPLAWDDIDDPKCVPDVGEDRWVPFMERYEELRELNLSDREIALKLGIQLESLERSLGRASERAALKESA